MDEWPGMFTISFLSSIQGRCALENIWRRRCSYLARSMFVWLSRPNPGADNENFRSNVSLPEGEKVNEGVGPKQKPQNKLRPGLKVSGGGKGPF